MQPFLRLCLPIPRTPFVVQLSSPLLPSLTWIAEMAGSSATTTPDDCMLLPESAGVEAPEAEAGFALVASSGSVATSSARSFICQWGERRGEE